jgi:hypothetical protein
VTECWRGKNKNKEKKEKERITTRGTGIPVKMWKDSEQKEDERM